MPNILIAPILTVLYVKSCHMANNVGIVITSINFDL